MDFITYLASEAKMIGQAPVTYGVTFLIVGLMVYLWVRHQYADRIASIEGRLQLRDDKIAAYEGKLNGATPDEAAHLIAALEKRLAAVEPLTLSPKQVDDLRALLSKQPATVDVVHDTGSATSKKLHGQMLNLFKQSGWAANSGMVMGVGIAPLSGIAIITPSGTPGLQTMIDAFHRVGLKFDFQDRLNNLSGRPNAIHLLITSPLE